MEERDQLTSIFEESRSHLNAVAYRMLGETNAAEDAVQEAWIRLNRSESDEIENLKGWLTTVVSRICLDMLRSRHSRKEQPLEDWSPAGSGDALVDIDTQLDIASSIGPALLVVLDHLAPRERVAFVLHDLFDISYGEIAAIINSTEQNTRQLASRARRRVRGASSDSNNSAHKRSIVAAFLTAAQSGNFDALLELLHPEIILTADTTAVKTAEADLAVGAPHLKAEIKGAKDVAHTFNGKAAGTEVALLDGVIGATWAPDGIPAVAIYMTIRGEQISAINIVMDHDKFNAVDIEILKER